MFGFGFFTFAGSVRFGPIRVIRATIRILDADLHGLPYCDCFAFDGGLRSMRAALLVLRVVVVAAVVVASKIFPG